MNLLNYIIWATDPVFFHLPFNDHPVRYYGLLFTLSLVISQQILFYIYKKESKPEKDVETLTIYLVLATVVGARLGHVFFYDFPNNPSKIINDPLYIFKIWEGGLASHGAAIGLLTALWFYTSFKFVINPFGKGEKFVFKKQKRANQSFLQMVDRVAILAAICGCLIRVGNFMNSEIVGKPTDSEQGVVFAANLNQFVQEFPTPIAEITYKKSESNLNYKTGYVPIHAEITFKNHPDVRTQEGVESYLNKSFKAQLKGKSYLREHFYVSDSIEFINKISQNNAGEYTAEVNIFGIPRYPAQLYEASSCLVLFILLFFLWNKWKNKTPQGLLFGIFLTLVFTMRFLYEFLKENQVGFEDDLALNMGQILSIPLVVIGLILLIRGLKKKNDPEYKIE